MPCTKRSPAIRTHREVTTILVRHVDKRRFADWSMKCVAQDHRVNRLLEKHGFGAFDPYRFDEATMEQMLGLFITAEDKTAAPDQGASQASGSGRPGFVARLFRRTKAA